VRLGAALGILWTKGGAMILDDLRAGRPCISLTDEQVNRLPAGIATRILINDTLRRIEESGHQNCSDCIEAKAEGEKILADLDKLEGKK
jgi:hypothetical protein